MKKTTAAEKLFRVLLENPSAKHWGYDLMTRAGLKSGTLYPILGRMVDEKLMVSEWGKPDEHHPNRKYYALTEAGERFCRSQLTEL